MEPNLIRSFYLKTVSAERMKIPPAFTEIYGDELLDTASVTVHNGPVWKLGLEKTDTGIWLHKGLHEFVEFYSIGRGNQLFFTYKDVCCFDVKIYDTTGCEIEYPCIQDTKGDTPVEILDEEEEKDDNSVEILGEEGDSLKTSSEDEDSLETLSEEEDDDSYVETLSEEEDDSLKTLSEGEDNLETLSEEEDDSSVEILGEEEDDERCDEISVSLRSGRPSHRDTLASKGELPKSSHVVMAGNKRSKIDHVKDRRPMTDDDFSRQLEPEEPGYSRKRPSSSGIKKSGKKMKKVEKPWGEASVSDEPEQEDRKVYHSHRLRKSVAGATARTKRAVNAAHRWRSENPRFILILQASAFVLKRLFVPAEFCAMHLSRDPIDIEVRDSNGRRWFFRSVPQRKRGCHLSRGWNKFIADNDLKLGDVCLFELIKSRKVVLKVSVFRAS